MRLGSLITPEGVKAEIDRQYNWEKTEQWRNSEEYKKELEHVQKVLKEKMPEWRAEGKINAEIKPMTQETKEFLEFINSKEGFEKIKQDAEDFYMMNIRQQKKIAAGREKEDIFWTSTGNQWMVLSNYLYDIDSSIFGDGRRDSDVEEVLSTITAQMDSLSRDQYINPGIGICFSKGASGKAFLSKSELITELEISMSALKYISDNYVDNAHKEEFGNLIQLYHKHNMEIIEEYENPVESFYKAVSSIYSYGYFNPSNPTPDYVYNSKLVNIHKTNAQKKEFSENLSVFLNGTNTENFMSKVNNLKDMFLSYVTDNSSDNDFKKYVANDSKDIFRHFVDLWAELGKL